MRIIAGQFRRRRLIAPPGLGTRPIPDRVKESIFGMLGLRIENAAVVDLFAGSGSIGLEAVSRGAASCMFVEKDHGAADVLEDNITALGCEDRARVVRGDALGMSIIARCPRPIDLVFIDPPYPMIREQTGAGWARVREQAEQLVPLLADDGFMIIRTPWPFCFEPETPPDPDEAPSSGARTFRRGTPKPGHKDRGPRSGRARGGGRPRDGVSEFFHADELDLAADTGSKNAGGSNDDPDADADFEETEHHVAPTGVAGAAEKQAADLTLKGASGPETHAYGSTAVHWYMKKR